MTQLLWRKHTEWPLLAVAILFLVAYSAQVIMDLPPQQDDLLELSGLQPHQVASRIDQTLRRVRVA